jgi:hypothetical protein
MRGGELGGGESGEMKQLKYWQLGAKRIKLMAEGSEAPTKKQGTEERIHNVKRTT